MALAERHFSGVFSGIALLRQGTGTYISRRAATLAAFVE
jgi:hypothetical protein